MLDTDREYIVIKGYGHFVQIWMLTAKFRWQAIQTAEKAGVLVSQCAYPNAVDFPPQAIEICESGDEVGEKYEEWLKEAIDKGMVVTPEEYERVCGLPFSNVW